MAAVFQCRGAPRICPSAMQIALSSVPSARPVEPTTPTDKVGTVKEKLRRTARGVRDQRKAKEFLEEMEPCLGPSGLNGNS